MFFAKMGLPNFGMILLRANLACKKKQKTYLVDFQIIKFYIKNIIPKLADFSLFKFSTIVIESIT